ncbi:MAG TPA: outer membrane beta-barrel protein [Bryobacteraceae bacterium]|nr:outer membrane beta-barrel protein [Bryobacteraceae bacterium]HOL71294.1 outer membrane beta-barrel protein [Bryobacteraceae bacterium]HPQ16031.1 outer membrane beta-barrel protein [Bryobacteraceae bacterium]
MRLIIVALMAAASAATALALVGEIAISGGASRMNKNSLGSFSDEFGRTADVLTTTDFRLGVRLTFNNPGHFGHEVGYAYNHGNLKIGDIEYGMPVHQGMYNFLVYLLPEGSKIRPFGTGGVHFSTFYPPGASVFYGNGVTKFGYNYGAGLKIRVSESWIARFDYRDYVTGKPDFGLPIRGTGMLHQVEISAGFGLAF